MQDNTEPTFSLDYKNLVFYRIKNEMANFFTGAAVISLLLIGSYAYIQNPSLFTWNHFENKLSGKKAAQAKPNTYTIQEGDWIVKVAEKKYGNPDAANEIMKANKITNPDEVNVGQVIVLPSAIPTIPATTSEGEVNKDVAQTKKVLFKGNKYKIVEGEGLWEIAEKVYGDGMMWSRLAESNNLSEKDRLEVGQIIKIPR